jgi:hypothetical protein
MTFRISPLVGLMFGINWLDWGENGYEELGYRYELQIAVGFFIIQVIS